MGKHVDVADVQSEPSSASVAPIDVRNEIAEEVTANVGDLKLTDDDSADQSTGEDQYPLSAEDVDMLLEKCLLQALHTTVKDKDLLMPGSTLWPSGITLDIKKSSYKKLSKWLQAKCSTGLLRYAFIFLFLISDHFFSFNLVILRVIYIGILVVLILNTFRTSLWCCQPSAPLCINAWFCCSVSLTIFENFIFLLYFYQLLIKL
ncbi:hypothetical protein RchiOBHm_Chr6g0249991 [Rosa chinensis]|uniref:eIF2D winged helix domain-containing protein n=1 Tax=Rosa chinensis TaxID=74649 RepID=A0A2P6PKH5_ROSCH|nr:hypothetical protein RchiOBHm_Chr6g0249991 [Rosa chinensis]